MNASIKWLPAGMLVLGVVFTLGIDTQRTMVLRQPLDEALPTDIDQHQGIDIPIPPPQIRGAGFTNYLMRAYATPDGEESYSLYVGYYNRQTQGKTIHSPKNCLPGNGWEALAAQVVTVESGNRPVHVNQYLLKKGSEQVLVFYWYQGRGRVQANEYLVKWDLLRDAALSQRSEEALVRIVVPVVDDLDHASSLARAAARVVIPALDRSLPI